ncbi:MAG: DEAD/DEAH box helicase [Ignavibacteria bacterium]|nr:DEAD/DEAH box helicase [Ignavibacteria bacterium]
MNIQEEDWPSMKFYLELVLSAEEEISSNGKKGIRFDKDASGLHNELRKILPFKLTGAQEDYCRDQQRHALRQMHEPASSGRWKRKTVVAVHSMLTAIANGYQCAFMCPTEILAEQHFSTLKKMFENLNVKVCLLIGGQRKKLRTELLNDIKSGTYNIVVGTIRSDSGIC